MPRIVAHSLCRLDYDADKFLAWFCKFRGLKDEHFSGKKYTSSKLYLYSKAAYYIWIIYLVAGVYVATFSPIFGIGTILVSPFITVGFIYTIAFAHSRFEHTKHRIQSFQNPKKKQ